jgi:hypothetical protein
VPFSQTRTILCCILFHELVTHLENEIISSKQENKMQQIEEEQNIQEQKSLSIGLIYDNTM